MKKVEFLNIHLENFGRFTEPIQQKLGHRTVVSGQNGSGKSTLKRMIMYVLGAKDENGKEITGIRPHDENGVDIDGLTTVAEISVSVDGQENTLKRTCFQEKNRQGEYTGKDNLQYFVDDVRKGTKKAYDEFVGGFLPSMACISAQEFLMKDTTGRREMLSVFSEHDTDGAIDENPEFEPLRAKVKANSVTDLKKACRDKNKKKTKERDGYPARIDEIEKQKVDIDVAELELLKNSLNEQIAANKKKQADVSKQFEEIDRQTDGIIELKCELSDLERKANEELFKQKGDLQSQIDEKNGYLLNIGEGIQRNNREIYRYEQNIENREKERQRLLDLYYKTQSEEFDENTAVCPTCHRELLQEERERLLSTFEQSKTERIAKIEKDGLEVKKDIENAKAMIQKLQERNKDNLANKEKLEKEVADIEKRLSELPDSIDISDREDVKAIKQQIVEKEAATQKSNSAGEIRQDLILESVDLNNHLNEVERQLSLAQKNIEIDERVEELRKAQMQLSQEIADIERELDLLKRFERKKAELLESDVNKHFELVKFKMFREMQNRELADICSPYVNGTSYDGNLNTSDKLLAEVDICTAFQKHYDVQLPILLDNAESVDDDRIPNVENQLIIFKRADNKELRIEVVE